MIRAAEGKLDLLRACSTTRSLVGSVASALKGETPMGSRGEKMEADDLELGEWTIQGLLVKARIEGEGPASECDGTCCRHGVYVSLEERDRILDYADRIQAVMDDTQTTDTREWFDGKVEEDEDFPGGVCVGTAVYEHKCAFLNRDGLCTLQLLEPELDLPGGVRLKPFYCRLFPLTTWCGRVEFDDFCDGLRPCCTLAADGQKRAVDAYVFEFTAILGEEGYRELRQAASFATESSALPS